MAKVKKYDYRLLQVDASWRAEIVRRVTARKSMVSKSQDGFATEAEAQAWAEEALKLFAENLSERNKRRSEKRNLETKKLETQQRKNEQLKEQKRKQALIDAAELAEQGEASPWPQNKSEAKIEVKAETKPQTKAEAHD